MSGTHKPSGKLKTTAALLGVATVIGIGVFAMMQTQADPGYGLEGTRNRVRPAVELSATPLPYGAVRLLESPFKDAMDRNADYLLKLEPDRLLHNFRKSAGLEPKGEGYGGWEARGVAGHTLGHYLTACALQYAATGDKRFLERLEYILGELDECQKKRGDGYIGGIPEADRIFGEVARGDIRSQGFDLNGGWVPWYTLHKLFAGLNDAYRHTGNKTALEVNKRLADWAIKTTEKLTEEQWQKMLACEHGGMNESLADLYALTGEKRYLTLAEKFYHKAVLDPLAQGKAPLAGLHANTQIPKVIGAATLYELTGEERYRTIASTFWDAVVHNHSYCIGGNSDGEHFGEPHKLANRLSTNTTETCNTYNMLKLTRHQFAWRPVAEYADYYERALYNHILASQNPEDGMVCYYVSLKPGTSKVYSTPFDSFWCCVGTGIENHTKYTEGIYFQSKDTLYWNLFIPSEATWKAQGVKLRQETRFPEEPVARLSVIEGNGKEWTVQVRYPYWAASIPVVKVNGETQTVMGKPGEYLAIKRKWNRGDTLEVTCPMGIHLDPMPDKPNRVALMYGPLVLAGDLGEAGGAEPRVPVLVADSESLASRLKPVEGKPLTFRTEGIGRPEELTFSPFYRVHNRRYSVYFDLFTQQAWAQREAEYRAEEARRKEREARTVDFMATGEMQPERDHNFTGEKTETGDFSGKKWRHSVDGGWFSFEMKVDPERPVDLVCTYWGSDRGGREFDILVDGEKVATQLLENARADVFFDQIYALPERLTAGKDKITVRFQAHPGKIAGGLYGCWIVRR